MILNEFFVSFILNLDEKNKFNKEILYKEKEGSYERGFIIKENSELGLEYSDWYNFVGNFAVLFRILKTMEGWDNMKSIKNKSVLLLIVTLFTTFVFPATQVVQAYDNDDEYVNIEETEYIEYIDIEYDELALYDDKPIQTTATVGISFKGVLVGWLIDGAIEYISGSAPSEWVAMGLTTIENRIRAAGRNNFPSIHVSVNGTVGGCITFPCMLSQDPVLQK